MVINDCRLVINDKKMYKAKYIDKNDAEYERLWDEIKQDRELLEAAIEVVRDKFDERNTFASPVITEAILKYPTEVEPEVYIELIEKIYSDVDLARIVLDGYANGGMSFLLYTLMNHCLLLDEEQRAFAVNEAMNMPNTKRSIGNLANYIRELDENKDKLKGDAHKEALIQKYAIFEGLSFKHAHGCISGPDIRYWILLNPNFILDFPDLLDSFYPDQEYYEQELDKFEIYFIDGYQNESGEPVLERDEIMDVKPKELKRRLSGRDNEGVNYAISELLLIQKMHILRPRRVEYTIPINIESERPVEKVKNPNEQN